MTQARRAAVGVFAIGGVLLFAVALFLIGDRRLLFENNFELHTTFTKVTGLQIGTKVRVSGYDAGEVLDIEIPSRPSEPFRVRMRLRDNLRTLVRTDSASGVQSDGLVGSYFIQISRGSDDAPVVEPGDTIRGIDPVDFADLINEGRETFQTVSREIVEVTTQVQEAIDPLIGAASTANDLLDQVGDSVSTMAAAGTRAADEATGILAEVRGTIADVRGGQGTLGHLLTDDAPFQRWVGIGQQAEQVVTNLKDTTAEARELISGLRAPDSNAQQLVQTMGDVMLDTREVVSDLSESTEALKRNFLFRGFFRSRGFFDLDAVSQAEYVAGALERDGRVPLRVWVEASGLFERDSSGNESLTLDGRRRLDAAMADLVRYARNSPLVVEGYATSTDSAAPFLLSSDRALLVRDYLVNRFRRRVTLTGVMPMGSQAAGSPSGDGLWSGVALALFADQDDIEP